MFQARSAGPDAARWITAFLHKHSAMARAEGRQFRIARFTGSARRVAEMFNGQAALGCGGTLPPISTHSHPSLHRLGCLWVCLSPMRAGVEPERGVSSEPRGNRAILVLL